MSDGTFQLSPEILLDVRRAVWLPASRTLAVADPHLGETWARRARGQLVPVAAGDDSMPRLRALMETYRPDRLIILGDVVHAALPIDGIEKSVRGLAELAAGKTRLELCLGNHDRHLVRRLKEWKLDIDTVTQADLPEAILFHGDQPPEVPAGDTRWRIQGHEHPAIVLGDGVATQAKVPCFVVGARSLVLPAFSDWAAGCVVGRDGFLARPARDASFTAVVACLGKRLLRMPLRQ